MIKAEIIGDKKVFAYLGDLKKKTISRVDQTITQLVLKLSRIAISKASGTVLQSRTGALVAAITKGTYINKQASRITGAVGLRGASKEVAIYGASQEFGATIKARLVEARNVSKLRFAIGNEFKFAKKIQLPEIKLPKRSFLKSSLAQMSGEAKAQIEAAAGISS